MSQIHLRRLISALKSDWTCDTSYDIESADMRAFIKNMFGANHLRLTNDIFVIPTIENKGIEQITLSFNVYFMIDKRFKTKDVQYIGKIVDVKDNNGEAIIQLQDDYEKYSIIVQVI